MLQWKRTTGIREWVCHVHLEALRAWHEWSRGDSRNSGAIRGRRRKEAAVVENEKNEHVAHVAGRWAELETTSMIFLQSQATHRIPSKQETLFEIYCPFAEPFLTLSPSWNPLLSFLLLPLSSLAIAYSSEHQLFLSPPDFLKCWHSFHSFLPSCRIHLFWRISAHHARIFFTTLNADMSLPQCLQPSTPTRPNFTQRWMIRTRFLKIPSNIPCARLMVIFLLNSRLEIQWASPWRRRWHSHPQHEHDAHALPQLQLPPTNPATTLPDTFTFLTTNSAPRLVDSDSYTHFGNSCFTCLWQFKNRENSKNSKNHWNTSLVSNPLSTFIILTPGIHGISVLKWNKGPYTCY